MNKIDLDRLAAPAFYLLLDFGGMAVLSAIARADEAVMRAAIRCGENSLAISLPRRSAGARQPT